MPDSPIYDDGQVETLTVYNMQFALEIGVGLTIEAAATPAPPWLSWDETVELACWLHKLVKCQKPHGE